MDKTSIIVGDEYAIREPVAKGVEFQRVRILANVRGSQWRAEWIEPNRGLIEYVQSRNVIVEWGQRKAFLRDEVREAELADHLSRRGHRRDDHPMAWAVTTVLETTGEQTSLIRGVLRAEPDVLQRLAERSRLDLLTHPLDYLDRHGRMNLPFQSAEMLAKAFAAAEPSTVLMTIDGLERQWEAEVRARGSEAGFMIAALNDYRAAHALIRQWAGHDTALHDRDARIEDLERLLIQVMWDLRSSKADPVKIALLIEGRLRRRTE